MLNTRKNLKQCHRHRVKQQKFETYMYYRRHFNNSSNNFYDTKCLYPSTPDSLVWVHAPWLDLPINNILTWHHNGQSSYCSLYDIINKSICQSISQFFINKKTIVYCRKQCISPAKMMQHLVFFTKQKLNLLLFSGPSMVRLFDIFNMLLSNGTLAGNWLESFWSNFAQV